MYQHHRRENCYVSFTSSGKEDRRIDSTVSRYRNIVEQMKQERTESGIPVLTTSIDFLFKSSQPDPGASLYSILFFHSICSSVLSIPFFFIYYYITCLFFAGVNTFLNCVDTLLILFIYPSIYLYNYLIYNNIKRKKMLKMWASV